MKELNFKITGIPDDVWERVKEGLSQLTIDTSKDEFVLKFPSSSDDIKAALKNDGFEGLVKASAMADKIKDLAVMGLAVYTMQELFNTKSILDTTASQASLRKMKVN